MHKVGISMRMGTLLDDNYTILVNRKNRSYDEIGFFYYHITCNATSCDTLNN